MKYLKRYAPFIVLPGVFFGCAIWGGTSYTTQDIKWGSSQFEVSVTRYIPSSKTKKNLIILPPTGGVTALDKSYARSFSRLGYNVYLMTQWTGWDRQSSDLEIHQKLYEEGQRAITIVLDQIPDGFIGLLGTSVGALHAEVAASLQARLDAVFTILGGASITEIIVTSDHKDMVNLKKERRARFKFKNDQEYLDALDKVFTLEPLRLRKPVEKALGMAMGNDDKTVPTKTQKQLEAFWQPQEKFSFDSGHFLGIIKTWTFSENKIVDFFERQAELKIPENK
ncbi:MAG: hypothetical protein H7Z71_10455 [Moraxellaceae bacterium]|nr:hypothetical protein [Pseudobdellovibrionaceae bacterium]